MPAKKKGRERYIQNVLFVKLMLLNDEITSKTSYDKNKYIF